MEQIFQGENTMNPSKSHPTSRFWGVWANAGAVDYTPLARTMGAAIFGYDPLIGCPFDDSEMRMVDMSGKFKVGNRVTFRGPNHLGTMIFPIVRGRVIAIGENAKFLNGEPFIALAIQVGASIYFKHGSDIQDVI